MEAKPKMKRSARGRPEGAIQNEPNVHAFYHKLLERGKKPMVAIVAVMRKLLHAIYGMLKHDQDFEGQKFYQMPASAT
jgi:hypothetical protein